MLGTSWIWHSYGARRFGNINPFGTEHPHLYGVMILIGVCVFFRRHQSRSLLPSLQEQILMEMILRSWS